MSRAAIETLLANDAVLAGYGIPQWGIFNSHDIKERPRNDGLFIVLRWEELSNYSQVYTSSAVDRAVRMLEVRVHSPREVSTNFDAIDKVLDRIDKIFLSVEHLAGSDANTVTLIERSGRGADQHDEGFDTVVRSALYAVLYRRS